MFESSDHHKGVWDPCFSCLRPPLSYNALWVGAGLDALKVLGTILDVHPPLECNFTVSDNFVMIFSDCSISVCPKVWYYGSVESDDHSWLSTILYRIYRCVRTAVCSWIHRNTQTHPWVSMHGYPWHYPKRGV